MSSSTPASLNDEDCRHSCEDDPSVQMNGDCDQLSEHVTDDDDDLETLSLTGGAERDPFICPLCEQEYKTPRVLNCLHVVCEECLKPLLVEDSIECPICKLVSNDQSTILFPIYLLWYIYCSLAMYI